MKILLAEDDGDDKNFFYDFLKHRHTLELMPAKDNGEELINYLQNVTDEALLPDAVILDQNMPKCNGLDTLSRLKADERFRHIPVMIYSTFIDNQLRERAMQAGAILVASKPSSQEGYNSMIDELILALNQ
jgi:DNA-binding NarL/FixJ family response regulator